MPRSRRWADLLPGVLALVALVAGVAAVLAFAHVGTIHGAKMHLFATVQEARGLSSGSEVWLAGRRVGVVDGVEFLPPSSDTTQRLLLRLEVLESARPAIRRGAVVGVRPGGNLIGAPVVTIDLGLPSQPAVVPGDTLHAQAETDLERAKVDFQNATGETPLILANLRVLHAQLSAARGTLGALGIEAPSGVKSAATTGHQLMAEVRSSRGSVGRLLTSRGRRDASAFAREALARADSIRQLIAAPPTRQSLGRFRRDSTLLRQIAVVRADIDSATSLLNRPVGTAGRLQQDSALIQDVARARAELAALIADLKRHPFRYLAF